MPLAHKHTHKHKHASMDRSNRVYQQKYWILTNRPLSFVCPVLRSTQNVHNLIIPCSASLLIYRNAKNSHRQSFGLDHFEKFMEIEFFIEMNCLNMCYRPSNCICMTSDDPIVWDKCNEIQRDQIRKTVDHASMGAVFGVYFRSYSTEHQSLLNANSTANRDVYGLMRCCCNLHSEINR